MVKRKPTHGFRGDNSVDITELTEAHLRVAVDEGRITITIEDLPNGVTNRWYSIRSGRSI
jgi:hypothetical protein